MTTVPSERFATEPGIERERERQHAGDHRDGRHDDRPEAFARGLVDRGQLVDAALRLWLREVDQQNPVLAERVRRA